MTSPVVSRPSCMTITERLDGQRMTRGVALAWAVWLGAILIGVAWWTLVALTVAWVW